MTYITHRTISLAISIALVAGCGANTFRAPIVRATVQSDGTTLILDAMGETGDRVVKAEAKEEKTRVIVDARFVGERSEDDRYVAGIGAVIKFEIVLKSPLGNRSVTTGDGSVIEVVRVD